MAQLTVVQEVKALHDEIEVLKQLHHEVSQLHRISLALSHVGAAHCAVLRDGRKRIVPQHLHGIRAWRTLHCVAPHMSADMHAAVHLQPAARLRAFQRGRRAQIHAAGMARGVCLLAADLQHRYWRGWSTCTKTESFTETSKACLNTSHHIASHHITSHHITSHHITPHHITSHHSTSHHTTSHHIIPYRRQHPG